LTSTQRNTSEGTPHTQTLTILGDTDHTFGDRTASERGSVGACFPATGVPFGILGEGFFALLGFEGFVALLGEGFVALLARPTSRLLFGMLLCRVLSRSSLQPLSHAFNPAKPIHLAPPYEPARLPGRTPDRTPIRSVYWSCPAPTTGWVRWRRRSPP
jgi:hypothetical protein